MDGVQLPQGYDHYEEAVYFLPLSSQKFLVLILSTSQGWKAESTLEPPSGFEPGTPGLGIQHLNPLGHCSMWNFGNFVFRLSENAFAKLNFYKMHINFYQNFSLIML